MNIFKRASLVVVAILLIFSSLTIGVSATGETGTMSLTITADKAENLYPGDIITFTVNISNDYNCTAMRWPVMFSSKCLELVTVDENIGNVQVFGSLAALGSDTQSEDLTGNTAVHASPYTKANYGCLLIQWLGLTNNGKANYYHETAGANCITFQLRVKQPPTVTTATVAIPVTGTTYKNLLYRQGTSDPENAVFYEIEQSAFTITSDPETITCFDTFAAITPKVNTDTIIDDEHGYIYGLTRVASNFEPIATPEDFALFITAVGGASYVVTPNSLNTCSTGATVEVFNGDNDSIATYTVVLFGDVNGDGVFDNTDSSMILDAGMAEFEFSWSGDPWDNATYLACDVTGDSLVNGDDYGVIGEASQQIGYICQTHNPDSFYAEFA